MTCSSRQVRCSDLNVTSSSLTVDAGFMMEEIIIIIISIIINHCCVGVCVVIVCVVIVCVGETELLHHVWNSCFRIIDDVCAGVCTLF